MTYASLPKGELRFNNKLIESRVLSAQYLKFLASPCCIINISASACFTRLSGGEQVKRRPFSSCTCSCLRSF